METKKHASVIERIRSEKAKAEYFIIKVGQNPSLDEHIITFYNSHVVDGVVMPPPKSSILYPPQQPNPTGIAINVTILDI